MLTIVLTYRNRDLSIVQRCLDSLAEQTDTDFQLYLVDYGSDANYAAAFQQLSQRYSFVTEHIFVPTNGQLWNKSRAINIALQKTTTPYFLMGDIDLIYHKEMVQQSKVLLQTHDCVYFQYGFLSKEETALDKEFEAYQPEFLGKDEVTGTTLYKTDVLKSIHGYDEFYHGWGAEDTDVHLRLKNAGYQVCFYDAEILVKHQWHPKAYRTKQSTAPFHTRLERINHDYMWQQCHAGISVANTQYSWGCLPNPLQVQQLSEITTTFELTTEKNNFDAFVMGRLPQLTAPISIQIQLNTAYRTFKNRLKKQLGKKAITAYTIEEANNILLSALIQYHRLASYTYSINWQQQTIQLRLAPYAA